MEVHRECRRRWGQLGWGVVPDVSPYEQQFGTVFSECLTLKSNLKSKHLYKVGYLEQKGKRLEYKVMSVGLTWEECFSKLDG